MRVRSAVMVGLGIATLTASAANAQTEQRAFKFAFGTGKSAPGYVRVVPTTLYSKEHGYGFEPGASVVTHDGFCTSDKAFLFSVALPEGNYNVTVTLGDPKGGSVTTVKAESRRLMLERVATASGQTVKRTFTVNIRNLRISTGGSVHLKPRELGPPLVLDWDDKLTLEFNNSRPCLDSLEITPADDAVTLYILGDSTVTDQPDEPWSAWGAMLPRFFKAGVAVANNAESGESLKSTTGAHRLDKVLSTMKPGDYMFIQFGHNDQKDKAPGAGAFTTYKADLERFVAEARKKGGIPVLVTSMNRRRFDESGKIVATLGDYPEAVRWLAKEQNVPLIDLNAMSKTLFEAMGPEGTLKAFVHYPAGTFPGQDKELKDDTHFNTYGAYELAKCIVEGIRGVKLDLVKYLTDDTAKFDPAHPDPVSVWNLPLSPASSSIKPDGN